MEDRTLLSVVFEPAVSVAAGTSPHALVADDFDGDGFADLVVANSGSGDLTVLLGAGDGTFTEATGSPVAVGDGPWSIVAGDFDGDGVPDLAVANYIDNTVSVLLGAGDGTFAEATGSPITVGTDPWSIAAGDFDGDGVPDLAVANYGDNTVSILLGAGDGTFAAATGSPIAVGTDPVSLAVGDLDGDGVLDLAVANSGDNNVSILLGAGDGTFAGATGSPVAVGTAPRSLAMADIDGDGVLDLAVANAGDNTVSILLGAGDGAFAAAAGSPVAVGIDPRSVTLADVNGDEFMDLVVANTGDNTVGVLLGAGDGTFSPATGSPVAVGDGPRQVVAADFDGDGIPDLATANFNTDDVSVVLSIPLSLSIDDASVPEGSTGDVTDMVFTVTLSYDPGVPVTVQYATMDGTAVAGVDYAARSGTLTFDGTTTQTITVPVLGNNLLQPDRQFTVVLSAPEAGDGSFVLLARAVGVGTIRDDDFRYVEGDFNGDGISDLALYYHDAARNVGVFRILLSHVEGSVGAASFSTRSMHEPEELTIEIAGVGPNVIPITGDFDGDGLADLGVVDPQARILGSEIPNASVWYILLSSDDWRDEDRLEVPFGAPGELDRPAPADYDGDGITDIATFRANSDIVPGAAQWFVLPSSANRTQGGNPDDRPDWIQRRGAFDVVFGAPGGQDLPAPFDFDGDGRADIATFRPVPTEQDLERGVPAVAQWFVLPSGPNDATFSGRVGGFPVVFGASGNADQPGVADWDGDGRDDITAFRSVPTEQDQDRGVPDVAQWFVLPTEPNQPNYVTNTGGYSIEFGGAGTIAAVGSYNVRGRPDLAVFDNQSGMWQISEGGEPRRLPEGFRTVAFGPTGEGVVPLLAPLYFRLLATGNVPTEELNPASAGLAAQRASHRMDHFDEALIRMLDDEA